MSILAGMMIEIKGTTYGASVRPTEVVLEKSDGTAYAVTQGLRRTVCSCPDFIKRHADLDFSVGCKHIQACVQLGLIRNVAPWEPESRAREAGLALARRELSAESGALPPPDARPRWQWDLTVPKPPANETEASLEQLAGQALVNERWYQATGRTDAPRLAELNCIEPSGAVNLQVLSDFLGLAIRRAGLGPQEWTPDRVRTLRERLDLSSAGLAERLGISLRAVQAYQQPTDSKGYRRPSAAVSRTLQALMMETTR